MLHTVVSLIYISVDHLTLEKQGNSFFSFKTKIHIFSFKMHIFSAPSLILRRPTPAVCTYPICYEIRKPAIIHIIRIVSETKWALS